MKCIFVSKSECTPSLVCGNCPNNKKPGMKFYGFDKIGQDGVMTGKQVYKQRKKFEKLLQKMLDKKIIKSWFYNGEYHITFNETH
jgi:hypothetical protein